MTAVTEGTTGLAHSFSLIYNSFCIIYSSSNQVSGESEYSVFRHFSALHSALSLHDDQQYVWGFFVLFLLTFLWFNIARGEPLKFPRLREIHTYLKLSQFLTW